MPSNDQPEPAATDPQPTVWELFILGLSVLVLVLLGIEMTLPITAETSAILLTIDTVICIFFLTDFVVSLVRAPNRLAYLRTWGWIDLLSSIPAVMALRLGRVARIVRIIRVLRIIRSARGIATFIQRRRPQSGLAFVVLIVLVLLTASAIGILMVETHATSNIQGAGDALWWAVATVTTVGYGDRYPVTLEGRIISTVLMISGIGLFGVLTSITLAWLNPNSQSDSAGPEREPEHETRLAAFTSEVESLRTELHAMHQLLRERLKP